MAVASNKSVEISGNTAGGAFNNTAPARLPDPGFGTDPTTGSR
jgi:hypothetical protein